MHQHVCNLKDKVLFSSHSFYPWVSLFLFFVSLSLSFVFRLLLLLLHPSRLSMTLMATNIIASCYVHSTFIICSSFVLSFHFLFAWWLLVVVVVGGWCALVRRSGRRGGAGVKVVFEGGGGVVWTETGTRPEYLVRTTTRNRTSTTWRSATIPPCTSWHTGGSWQSTHSTPVLPIGRRPGVVHLTTSLAHTTAVSDLAISRD